MVLLMVIIIGFMNLSYGRPFFWGIDAVIVHLMLLSVVDIFIGYIIVLRISSKLEQECIERERQLAEEEENRIAEVTGKVETFLSRYTLPSLSTNRTALPFKIEPALINQEVVFAVKSYKERMTTIYERYQIISDEINEILSCLGCSTIDEKYSHLTTNEDTLKQLKEEADGILSDFASSKIELLHNDGDLLFEMKQAFNDLLNSKKCQSDSMNIKEFITPDKPSELMLFRYENEPVILFWEQYYFCLFSNVILVFDSNGNFSSALDPTALHIAVVRKKAQYRFDENIDTDSRAIAYTETRTRWLFACKDGSPDLRYNGNRPIEYTVEVNGYEYGTITIKIGKHSITFSVSSSKALDLFETIPSIYCRICNNKHDPIPEFLVLIKMLGREDDVKIKGIMEVCNAKADVNNYFCKLTAS